MYIAAEAAIYILLSFLFFIKVVRIILPAEMNFPPMYIFEYEVDALPECVYSDSTLSLAQLAVD